MKRVIFLLGLAVTLLLPVSAGIAQGPASPGSPVVQLIAVREERGGRLVLRWAGSGVIVSADGLILTNCHVAMVRAVRDDREFDYDLLIVALAVRRHVVPQPLYLAEVVRCDPDLDLAVVQTSAALDGRALPTDLDLPVQSLGRTEQLQVGDAVRVLGYPGGAGERLATVDATAARLPRGRQAGWIELDIEVEGGLSGGPVINAAGELVGVVAVGAVENAESVAHCCYTGDTGGDGRLDLDDACTAVDGAIVTAWPIQLAETLLRAAGYGCGGRADGHPTSPTPDADGHPGAATTPRTDAYGCTRSSSGACAAAWARRSPGAERQRGHLRPHRRRPHRPGHSQGAFHRVATGHPDAGCDQRGG